MKITVNIEMMGLDGGDIEQASKFLSCIEKFDVNIVMHLDSNPSIGKISTEYYKDKNGFEEGYKHSLNNKKL